MLFVTDAARVFLKDALEQSHAPDGTAVRIVSRGDALTTKIDTLHEGDEIVEDEGRVLLVVEPGLSDRLSDLTLDVEPSAHKLLLC